MGLLYKCLNFTLDTLAPDYCLLCRRRSDRRLNLCTACSRTLPVVDSPCPRCALPGAGGYVCGRCQSEPPAFDRVFAAFSYEDPVDRLVWRLKFAGDLPVARLMGTLLAECIAACPGPRAELILPVPLHRRRLMKRGFNQSTEITRVASRRLGIPMSRTLLRRVRATPSQQTLGAAGRRRNVRDCFKIEASPPVRRIALVDDVMTSGATLDALARAIKQLGDYHVECWVVARA